MSLPAFLTDIPDRLIPANPEATEAELMRERDIRRNFLVAGEAEPYVIDMVRFHRLHKGCRVYVEVGSRDKGNIASILPILADDALVVDIDIDQANFQRQAQAINRIKRATQRYVQIEGDCLSPETLSKLRATLNGAAADIIFCDSLHLYQHTLHEFSAYYPLIKSGGLLSFHDCYFEGTSDQKGKALALQVIAQRVPVYSIFANEPVHRHLLRETNAYVWGGCAVICKP